MNSLLRLNDMDQWLRMLEGEGLAGDQAAFSPDVEVREDENAYTILAELPGVARKDVHVTLKEGVLTLSGEKKLEAEEKAKGRYHVVERSYGSFQRSFRLGSLVSEDKVEARFKDGVLSVTVPKAAEAKPREIVVKE